MNKTKIEKANDILIDSTGTARALIDAIRELGQMDNIIDYDLVMNPSEMEKPENWKKYQIISEILRLHETVSGLCYALSGELGKIEQVTSLLDNALIDNTESKTA